MKNYWWREASLADKMTVYEMYCQRHDKYSFEEFDEHYKFVSFYTVMRMFM